MQDPRHNLDDEWEGLEPEQPKTGSQTTLYVGIAVAAIVGLVVCLGAVYLVWSQFQVRTTPDNGTAIALPTAIQTETPAPPTATLDIAPTATLQPTATSISLGSGSVEAAGLPVAPSIDGDLSEWSGVATTVSAFRVYSVGGWDGTDDLTAVWQLAWDDSNLYVAVTVTDDVHVQTASGNQIFRGDGVDMQFDTARDSDFGSGLSPDDFQITLSPGDFDDSSPAAFRYQGTAGGAILDAPGGHNVTLAAQQTGTGYTLEAAIPWTDLNLSPAAGLTIGLALNANDNDTPGTAVQEVMMSHMPDRTLTNPTTWGTLTLK